MELGDIRPGAARWREFAIGFVFWFAFVLVLEPGNVLRTLQDGGSVPAGQEVLRLVAAGLLGASATPLVFWLTERFPIEGVRRWRHLAPHLAADAVLAAALVAISCVLAVLLLPEEHRGLGQALREQFAADGPLLFFCLISLWRMRSAA
jgi:hypothetical protein